MSKNRKLTLLSVVLVLGVLVIDQVIKIWVKTHMYLGESIEITSWFQLRFIENNGMAFGWELGGKYLLTSFRILMAPVIGYFIWKQIEKQRPVGLIVCLSLILAGDLGNVFDCLFYGEVFNSPAPPSVAQFVPWGEGYSSVMLGKVVDMFYFPLFDWNMPDWDWLNSVPFLPNAGEHCVFFSAIFNFADASISCSIIALLLFYSNLLKREKPKTHESEESK